MSAPNATAATILQILKYADTAFDIVAPFLGVSELSPLVDAANALAQKIGQTVAASAPPIAAEIAAADAAAKAAELVEGLK